MKLLSQILKRKRATLVIAQIQQQYHMIDYLSLPIRVHTVGR